MTATCSYSTSDSNQYTHLIQKGGTVTYHVILSLIWNQDSTFLCIYVYARVHKYTYFCVCVWTHTRNACMAVKQNTVTWLRDVSVERGVPWLNDLVVPARCSMLQHFFLQRAGGQRSASGSGDVIACFVSILDSNKTCAQSAKCWDL